MGEIRSALEIALEKTAHIEGDKTSAATRDLKNLGKKTAGDYLASGDESVFERTLASRAEEERVSVRQGACSILIASIRLPDAKEDLEKTRVAGKGLDILLPGTGMAALFGQLEQILLQYLAEGDRLLHALEQQFIPRLRAKQQELARRYGQTIPLELHQDPEYQAALAKGRRALEDKYGTVIDEVRSQAYAAAGIEQ